LGPMAGMRGFTSPSVSWETNCWTTRALMGTADTPAAPRHGLIFRPSWRKRLMHPEEGSAGGHGQGGHDAGGQREKNRRGLGYARSWFVVSTLSRPLGPSRFPSLALNSRQYM
jgi:hypothetical protein